METLLDHLQEQGYEPDENGSWFNLIASGVGSIHVVLDDGDANVNYFDGHGEWTARFSAGTPDAVILTVLAAAEDALAARRHGPVTPAQVAARAVRDA